MVFNISIIISNSILNPSETVMALSISNFTMQLFNFKDFTHYGTLTGHNSQITDICFGSDTELYSSSSY